MCFFRRLLESGHEEFESRFAKQVDSSLKNAMHSQSKLGKMMVVSGTRITSTCGRQ